MTVDTIDLEVGSPEWAATITASKVAAIVGLSKWDSPKSMWFKMRHPEKFAEDKSNKSQELGTDMEPVCLNRWFKANPEWERHGGEITFQRDDLGFPAAATPDDDAWKVEIIDGVEVLIRIGAENKVVSRDDEKEWGRPGTAEIPVYYLIQVQWQMHISGRRLTAVIKNGPWIDQQDTYWIEYDEDMALAIERQCREFAQSVIDGIEPENDGRIETLKAMRRVYSDINPDDEWPINPELAIEVEEARRGFEEAEERLNRVKANLLTVMNKAKLAIVGEGKDALKIARRQKSGKGIALYILTKPEHLPTLQTLRDNQSAA